ncbi:MAG TPA: hypothetical protein VE076_13025 [Nitrososphaeraceae archaeon]|jgi:regulator of replication initiation timing|nr:hypothetical protein [Nitrososphaeraceae archaeon]
MLNTTENLSGILTDIFKELKDISQQIHSLQKSIANFTQLLSVILENQRCTAIAKRERGF